jgi:hypothetical protein
MTKLGAPLHLLFDGECVGIIYDAFCSDNTWFGRFTGTEGAAPRVTEFIAFCIDWHARIEAPETEAREFDAYADVLRDGRSSLRGTSSSRSIVEAPVFFPGGDVTWTEA